MNAMIGTTAIAMALVAAVNSGRQEKPSAQLSARTQEKIPVRALAPLAVSSDTFGLMLPVRQLPGGRVLVNDAKKRRLIILDSALHVVRVVLDTVMGRDDSYGPGAVPVIPYLGDSSIFVDIQSKSLILITPDGTVGRTIAAPNDNSIWVVAATASGLDDKGRLVYRGLQFHQTQRPGELGLSIGINGAAAPTSNADSTPIIRGDFATRQVDTVAALANLSAQRTVVTRDANGNATWTTLLNPRPTGDEWAVMSDGTIAIVRGHDYHVDWITSDGAMRSSDKLPFDWKRITDEEKLRLRDSTANTMSRADSMEQQRQQRMASGDGASVGRSGGSGGDGRPAFVMPVMKSAPVPLSEIPDYMPPLRPGSVMADRDNNLWILPSTSAQSVAGELVYDLVNRQGTLFERVRMPVGRSVIGFGKDGVVYLMHGTLAHGFQIERTRVVRGAAK